ncbi:MAG: type II toxin-antitoxin system RelE/ParE family toxin [Bacteroidota bacterium]
MLIQNKVIPEVGVRNYREIEVGSYRIFYKIVSEDRIDILSVFHAARNFNNFI